MTGYEILYVNNTKRCILARKVLKSIRFTYEIIQLDWALTNSHTELGENWRHCRSRGIAYFVKVENQRITYAGWDATNFGYASSKLPRRKLSRVVIQTLCQ
jgi:hypothetical protein